MILFIIACACLAYISVYVLFWLFDNHERLLHAEPPPQGSPAAKLIATRTLAELGNYGTGFIAFSARAFNVKMKELSHYPPPLQIWGAVLALFLMGFLFSSMLPGEAFDYILWEQLGVVLLLVFIPVGKMAQRKFASRSK